MKMEKVCFSIFFYLRKSRQIKALSSASFCLMSSSISSWVLHFYLKKGYFEGLENNADLERGDKKDIYDDEDEENDDVVLIMSVDAGDRIRVGVKTRECKKYDY